MGRTRPSYTRHDLAKRNRLVGAIKATGSVAKAARQENVPESTARAIFKKFQETGSTADLHRSGRPATTTPRDERHIIREATTHRRKTLAEVAKDAVPHLSASTVRRVLSSEGYHRRVARRVSFLNYKQKMARKRWAYANRNRSPREWGNIIWSDETYIYVGKNDGRVYVTRRAGEEFDEDCVVPTFKQSSLRVMVWGCIMKGKKGPLVVLEYPGGKGQGMNSARYQDQVLGPVLSGFYKQQKRRRPNVLFQQDGASGHSSKSTTNWLSAHGIRLFPHPSSSPDLSPIEPVWHELKKLIRARSHTPSSISELITAVHEAWDALAIEDIDKYVDRMGD